jgi:vancomycin resistance protein YoaR
MNMTTDELDPFEPKEQSKGAVPKASAPSSATPESIRYESASTVSASAPVAPKRGPRAAKLIARARFETQLDPRAVGFAIAFAVGAIASLFIVTAVAMGLSSAYSNRVVPGVRVGSVDVSGMSRDQVIAKLQTVYAYLGQGEVTVTTPAGVATITYQQARRGPDVEVMADLAMTVGHTGSPIGDAASIIRSAIVGQSVPVVVDIDPMALATRVHQLVGTSAVPPQDAQVTIKSGTFALSPSSSGRGIDEKAISGAIIDRLTRADAPADLQAGGTFVALDPQVSDRDAQDAIAAAQKMIVDVKLAWGGVPPISQTPPASPTPTASPTPIPTPIPTQTFTIDAQTIRGWIVFGTKTDGGYGPAADPALVEDYLRKLAPKVAIPPVEPSVVYDSAGKPVSLKAGKNGIGIDVGATSQAIEAYLDSLVSGGNPGSTIAIAMAPIQPQISDISKLNGLVMIGQGHWTTTFFPGEANGNGLNIRVPSTLLNGQVVAPGQQFSFLDAVGPIDAAHGYTMGGVIIGGKSNHTGAMGGGICSASTTMFNAAARAGLQIDERHAHFYYINRYPMGLDATVYSNGYEVWDLRWTNDTPYPIVIRSYTTKGSRSTMTVELWSLPLNRTVTFAPKPAPMANIVKATTGAMQYNVSTLKPGQTWPGEVADDGFDTYQTRTVTDSNGNVIHLDRWNSHYSKIDGLTQVGGPPPPSGGTPSPSPSPTPTPGAPTSTPAPTPGPSASAARRRKVR